MAARMMFSTRSIERLAGALLVASFVAFLGHVVTLSTLGAGRATILFVLTYGFLVSLSALVLHLTFRAHKQVLSLFGALLSRCTRQEDLVIGSPVTLRHRAEFQDMPGFFLNTLPFRLDFSDRPTLRSLIREVRQTSLAAIEHADVPLDSILLQTSRAAGQPTLFDIAFVWLDEPAPAPSIGTAQAYPIPVHNSAAKFELALELGPSKGGAVYGLFEFSTDLFDRATIERLRDHFCVLA